MLNYRVDGPKYRAWYPDILPKDTLPKDILPNGHFADGHFHERTFHRKGILPKRQLAENREILGVKLNNIVSEFDTYENTITYCEAIAHNL